MLRFILALLVFVFYSIVLLASEKVDAKSLTLKIGYSLIGTLLSLSFLVPSNLLANFLFFGNFLSPLEQQSLWIPIIRGPILEEGYKLLSLIILKKKLNLKETEIMSYGGLIGNWFSFFENTLYLTQKSLNLTKTLIRLLP